MTGTEIEEIAGNLPAAVSPRGIQLIEHLGIKLADTQDIQWRIAERLALAGSIEQLLADDDKLGLREHLGEPFYVRGVDYLPSAFPGSPLYAVIDGATPDGESIIRTTGALSVVIQLARGQQLGDWDGVLVKAAYSTEQPTADGNRPYKLRRA